MDHLNISYYTGMATGTPPHVSHNAALPINPMLPSFFPPPTQSYTNPDTQYSNRIYPVEQYPNTIVNVSAVQNDPDIIKQRKIDQSKINRWLTTRKIIPCLTSKSKPNLTIHETKETLTKIVKLKEDIVELKIKLEKCDEEFDEVWEVVLQKQNEINEYFVKLHPSAIQQVKKLLEKRSKKRIRQREHREENMIIKELTIQKRRLKDKKINDWLRMKEKEVDAVKQEENLKRQADCVLQEVTKKKAEAKKILNLLSSMSKLRDLRYQHETMRGVYCSATEAEAFTKIIEKVKAMWEEQMKVYLLEEKGLNIMLEESALEKSNSQRVQFRNVLSQWECVLFGDEIPTNEDYKILTASERDVDVFLAVRQEWDQFVATPNAILSSTIPGGWVLPVASSSEDWKRCLK